MILDYAAILSQNSNLFQSVFPNNYVLNTILYTMFNKIKKYGPCL